MAVPSSINVLVFDHTHSMVWVDFVVLHAVWSVAAANICYSVLTVSPMSVDVCLHLMRSVMPPRKILVRCDVDNSCVCGCGCAPLVLCIQVVIQS